MIYAQQQDKVKLDVGGQRFSTSKSTLLSQPDTFFSEIFSGEAGIELDEDDGSYFIDRDGRHFHYILDYLRAPDEFQVPRNPVVLKELLKEIDYYRVVRLHGSTAWGLLPAGLRTANVAAVAGEGPSCNWLLATARVELTVRFSCVRGCWCSPSHSRRSRQRRPKVRAPLRCRACALEDTCSQHCHPLHAAGVSRRARG